MYITKTTNNVKKLFEKLDVFSEIIIRYDNETFFDERTLVLSFGSELDGFNISKIIKSFKD